MGFVGVVVGLGVESSVSGGENLVGKLYMCEGRWFVFREYVYCRVGLLEVGFIGGVCGGF